MAICNWVVYDCWLLTVICKLATNFQLGAQINVLTPSASCCLTTPPTVVKLWCFFPGVLHGALCFSILLCISFHHSPIFVPSLPCQIIIKMPIPLPPLKRWNYVFIPRFLAIHKYCSFRVVGYKSNLFPGLKPGKSIVCNNLSSLKTLNIFYIFILPPTLAHTRRYLTLRKEDKWHGHVIEKISMVYSPTSFQNIFLLGQCNVAK